MPKVNLTTDYFKTIVDKITYAKKLYGYTNEELAAHMQIKTLDTIRRRLQNPKNITIGELYGLSKLFKIPMDELVNGKKATVLWNGQV